MKVAFLLLLLLAIGSIAFLWWWTRPPKPFTEIVTLAIAGGAETPVKNHFEPFGLTADDDGNIFMSESVTGRIYRIPAGSYSSIAGSQEETVVADQLQTPSALAFDNDQNLIVANTGAHTIVRINLQSNQTSVIAGADGMSGDTDGPAAFARFNGPVGIAVDEDGSIFVADTYNDRIRLITRDGHVRTLAGGREPGFADGVGQEARFDTPCGIAVDKDGSLLVADTGNHLIRRVELNGRVTTIAGTGEAEERDGLPLEAAFDEPTAIAVRDKKSFYVADAAGSAVRLCVFGEEVSVKTIGGGYQEGLIDGEVSKARLNRPAGLAVLANGELAFADSGNGLVRAFIPPNAGIGRHIDPKSVGIGAPEMSALLEPRWPFDNPQSRRDIAGTFGEIRGERLPDHEAWFHNGLDLPGAYGESVHAVLTENVTRPIAVSGDGGIRERLRLPLFEYIHLRIGRDRDNKPIGSFPSGAITFRLNQEGDVIGVRVRRGTRINAGDVIGTLNRLNHVHLVAGPSGIQFNALLVLKLPGLTDTVAPLIEAITILNERNEPATVGGSKRLTVSGKLRIAVRAYDQVDGNPRHRRLGVHRLGYQVFNADGSPAPDFREPRYHIVFDRLPSDPNAVQLAFAEGSQSGYEGPTVFNYIISNIVRGGEASEDFWDTTKLAAGDYTLRVFAEDYFGNQARRDLPVRVMNTN
jgi:sugar lactone lactonase YvrE